MTKLKILIAMSTIGGGHTSVAMALKEEFEERGHKVVLIDAWPKFFVPMYGIISRHLLSLWGLLYWKSNEKKISNLIAKLGSRLMAKKITRKVLAEVPDFVISDYPFITELPDEIFLQSGHVSPLGVMVVDPVSAHPIWFKGNPDVYFIPSADIEKMALKAGVKKEKIVFTGYPIKKDFYNKIEVKFYRKCFGLDTDKVTLMIGGSSEGVGKIEDLCELLSSLPLSYNFQAIVICGRNKELFKKLAIGYYDDGRFKILGFEKNMAVYLKICDFIVSKAGPTHLYEAVAAEKPFLAFSCMPGQEEGNLGLIRKEKIGVVEEDLEKAFKIIKKWIKKPSLLDEYREGINNLRKRQMGASERVVSYVEGFKGE